MTASRVGILQSLGKIRNDPYDNALGSVPCNLFGVVRHDPYDNALGSVPCNPFGKI